MPDSKPAIAVIPTRIQGASGFKMELTFNNGDTYLLPYLEVRYACPCAVCVDEWSGERKLKRASLKPDIKPVKVDQIGQYALKIEWSDRHSTGMFHYDRLLELCKSKGTLVGAIV